MKSIKATIKGKEWQINIPDGFLETGNAGECDYSKRVIDIRSGQLDELDTTIHEFLHAYDKGMSHPKIKSFSRQLACLLSSLGWRRMP
jgi:hypothetical protein